MNWNELRQKLSAFGQTLSANRHSLIFYVGLPAVAVISIVLFTVVISGGTVPAGQNETSVSVSDSRLSGVSQADGDEDSPDRSPAPVKQPSVSEAVTDSQSSAPEADSSEFILLPVDEEVAAKYAAAEEENEDVKAWLRIPDTPVDYPVMQAHDNSFYLEKGLNKSYYYWGSIFAHFRNPLAEADRLSGNTVLFGHNKNDGLLFGELMNFTDTAYAKEHRLIQLTVGNETTQWLIFSVMDCEVNNRVFYYINPAPTEEQSAEIIEQSLDRSFWDYNLDVNAQDRLLTLSTCTYKYTYQSGTYREDVRFVVMARQVRPGEDISQLEAPTVNSDRRQPVF